MGVLVVTDATVPVAAEVSLGIKTLVSLSLHRCKDSTKWPQAVGGVVDTQAPVP